MNVQKNQYHSSSDVNVGKVRSKNEDACLEMSSDHLWVVADGIGGQPKGEYASQLAIDSLAAIRVPENLSDFAAAVEMGVLDVNKRLIREARKSAVGAIGTTIAVLIAKDDLFIALWAGDSRIYRLRGGLLTQITVDHSAENFMPQGVPASQSGALVRAVGIEEQLVLDAQVGTVRSGDRFLICTDGLTKELTDGHIAAIMLRRRRLKNIVKELMNSALDAGGRDNIAIVVVEQK